MEVQENLNNMIDEYKAIYDDVDSEPITLKKDDIQSILIESGIPEEVTMQIEKSYEEVFGDDLPLAENLIDSKVLKANEQIKREKHLQKQVEILQNRLEEVKQEAAIDNEISMTNDSNLEDDNDTITLETSSEVDIKEELDDTNIKEDTDTLNYDVILQVKPEKIPQIKSQIIDGQKCIVIPINENEQTTVNGLDDLI